MRIALVSDCFLPEVNGITFCVQNLLHEYRQNHEVALAIPAYANPGPLQSDVERFGSIRVPLDKQTQLVWPDKGHMRRWLETHKPEVVHIHTLGGLGQLALAESRARKIPVVVTYHTLVAGTLASYPAFRWIQGVTEQAAWRWSIWSCNRAGVVIAPAQIIGDALLHHGLTAPLRIVPNGIETTVFRPAAHGAKNFTVVYVGRIGYEKGVDVLVEAARLTPEVQWVFAGDGPAWAELARTAPANVRFVGAVKRQDLPQLYQQAQVFATAAQFEVNPLVVLEAAASGLVILGANKGGMKQVFTTGKQGYLFDEVMAAEYAKAVETLRKQPTKLKQMAHAARVWAQERDVSVMAKQTLVVYEELIQKT